MHGLVSERLKKLRGIYRQSAAEGVLVFHLFNVLIAIALGVLDAGVHDPRRYRGDE